MKSRTFLRNFMSQQFTRRILLIILFIQASSCGMQGTIKGTETASASSSSEAISKLALINGGNSFGSDSTIGNLDNFNLDFLTNGLPRVTILANGNVGIGKNNPASPLSVNGAISATKYQLGEVDFISGDQSWQWTAVGFGALAGFKSWGAVAIGRNALGADISTSFFNTAVGTDASARMTGFKGTSLGYNAAKNLTYTEVSTFLGAEAGLGIGTGYAANGLTVVGGEAGSNLQTGADDNTFVGAGSGKQVTTGSRNTFVGGSTYPRNGPNITTGSTNIAIGYDTGFASATASNQMNIGNLIFGTGMTGSVGSPAGNIGIGTAAPQTKLQVAGVISPSVNNTYSLGDATYRFTQVYATNGTINTSDRREKKNIEASQLGLDFINKLKPVSYKWSTGVDDDTHFGFIAQDTSESLKIEMKNDRKVAGGTSIVTYDKAADRFGLRYTELIAPIVKAIQEISHSFEALQSKFTFFEDSLRQNQSELESLKKENAEYRFQVERLQQQNEKILLRLQNLEKNSSK